MRPARERHEHERRREEHAAEHVRRPDAEIIAALRFAFDRMKLVLEPSGASALAALLAGRVRLPGQRVGVVLSGGNVGADRFAELINAD